MQEATDLLTRKMIEESDLRQRDQSLLRESMDLLSRKMLEQSDLHQRDYDRAQVEMQELRRIVFRHTTDPSAHSPG